MKIVCGLAEHMVMQRNENNICEQKISGISIPGHTVCGKDANGKILFSVVCDSNGNFQSILSGWKSGGPYSLTVSDDSEELKYNDLWVGDVWVLAGQSNMQGIAMLNKAPAPRRQIRALYLDNRWDIAQEPLHNMREAKAEIHWVINGGHDAFANDSGPLLKGVGPGMFFAGEMWKRTHIPQGLIASAHGGTAMELWDPELRDQGDNSLYGAMYNRIMNCGGKIAGLLWYQGCSDTNLIDRTELYEKRTLDLFNALRKDLAAPNLPIAMVQLGRTMSAFNQQIEVNWSKIRNIQLNLPGKIKNLAVVPAIDLTNDDSIHLCCDGHRILGKRLADAIEYINGIPGIMPPIVPGKMSCRKNPLFDVFEITLSFKNVVGKLQSNGNLPLGFTLHFSDKQNLPATPPFRCELRGKKVILYVNGELGTKVAYGFGCNPAVNIHDDAGRSLPAFGPIYFHPIPKSTPMLSHVEISEPLMGDDSYDTLFPEKQRYSNLKFNKFEADSTFITPKRLIQQGKYVYFIRWKINCRHSSKFTALIGSDGPFRLTCDGKEVAGFAQVANPIIPDEFSVPLELPAGEHEFVMGLGGKSGNAWGFCLRFVDPTELLTEENESIPSESLPDLL